MKPQFQHTLVTSFYLWFDNYLQKNGEAYKNKTGIFNVSMGKKIYLKYLIRWLNHYNTNKIMI